MAKAILKKTPIHCVVKISAASTETITLGTDLLHTNETATTPRVNIAGIYWSVASGQATITRNGTQLYALSGSYEFEFNGFTDSSEQTSDIVITVPAGGGVVIVELVKVGGYGNEQHRNQLGGP